MSVSWVEKTVRMEKGTTQLAEEPDRTKGVSLCVFWRGL